MSFIKPRFSAISGLLLLCLHTGNAAAISCKPDSITPSNQSEQYLDNGDGTVTDLRYGLMWMRCSLGQSWVDGECRGTPSQYSIWQQALHAASQPRQFAGYADWRLPNMMQLATLVERSCYQPAISLSVFPSTPAAVYWSSTPDAAAIPGSGLEGRAIDFSDGSETILDTSQHRFIRLVRPLLQSH